MNITVLIENLVYRKGLGAEHGLSLYIETGRNKILFDTGQTGAFAENAQKLDIDISDVDYLVISHGHFDHTGGINKFIDINSKAKILLSRRALNPKYKNEDYIGIPPFFAIPPERFHFIDSLYNISKNVSVLGDIRIENTSETHFSGFYEEHNGELVPDTFHDELFLSIETEQGIHIFSGCSHNGISNILLTAKAHFLKPVISLIGGFHLADCTYHQVENLVEFINIERVKNIYTGHCTGLENYCTIKKLSNAIVKYMHSASVIEI
jgi:7,8-dihydropterin-6-yl-methyl-4-(beta-D-ribofuranosyl)aminobenzene 5'-phosphate synthase